MRPRALAIFAHPDDAVLLAGGTLARLAACGTDVRLLCLTCGHGDGPGTTDARRLAGVAAVEPLEEACRALGIRRPIAAGCPRRALASQCRTGAEYGITTALATLRPHLVITLGPGGVTGHPDHIAAGEIATAAFHRVFGDGAGEPQGALLYYAVGSAAMWRAGPAAPGSGAPRVTTIVDVRPVAARKSAAIVALRASGPGRLGELGAMAIAISAPERFHRAVPDWRASVPGSSLEDLLGDVPCRTPAPPQRPRQRSGWAARVAAGPVRRVRLGPGRAPPSSSRPAAAWAPSRWEC